VVFLSGIQSEQVFIVFLHLYHHWRPINQ